MMKKTAIQELRMLRNIHLSATDWWGLSDRTMSKQQTAYRQALRDLPKNSPDVAFDDNGNLINVDWPEVPA